MSSPEPEDETQETYVVTMVDEEGDEQDFALLDMIEVDGKLYGLFAPADELEDDDVDEAEAPDEAPDEPPAERSEEEDDDGILVLRVVQRGGEQDFEIIEDQAEFDRVLEHLERMAATQIHLGPGTNSNN